MTALADASIGRLRVPAARAAPARHAVERWLAGVEPQRYGLPATAVLVVRRARAPLVSLGARSANDPLRGIVRNAVRPATAAFVGAGAEAVWFADEAELLACLARDILAGSLAACWWWVALLGPSPEVASASRRWQACARWVPHALMLLERSGDDRRWLERLGPAGRASLLAALAAAYPVCAEVRAALGECESASVAVGHAAPSRVEHAATAAPGHARARGRADAPTAWLRLASALLRDPQRAAAAGFAPVVGAIESAAADRVERSDGGAAARMPTAPGSTSARPGRSRIHRGVDRGVSPPSPPALRLASRRPPDASAAAAGAVLPAAAPDRDEDAEGVSAAAPTSAASAASVAPVAQASPRRTLRRRAEVAPGVAGAAFETAFGGLFFLLNVALSLGLYGDFTRPLHRGLPVSPWQFLAGAGRAWVGHRFAADPLAAWLRTRAPVVGVPALPERWIADPDWLLAFAADTRPWHALTTPDALRLQHPAGFTIARQAGIVDPAALLAALGAQGHPVREHRCARRPGAAADLLRPLWPLLGARLALALGMPARHATRLLLALPARVQATPARLDLHLVLAALPLALRIAGLDRDPGWVPAAGCDIRFHFE